MKGRLAIVIDDGVATGATTRAALRATRMRQPDKLILAVPVGPTDTIAAMREEADEAQTSSMLEMGLGFSTGCAALEWKKPPQCGELLNRLLGSPMGGSQVVDLVESSHPLPERIKRDAQYPKQERLLTLLRAAALKRVSSP